MSIEFERKFSEYLERINTALPDYLPATDSGQAICAQAMKYSLMAGGKRIRAIMVQAFCELCGGDSAAALPYAAAIEMIHAYSLIHDDLPCMDDDEMRRGKPSCHIAFGEANALLAGDGLLTLAFETILDSDMLAIPASRALKAAHLLARAAGIQGMVGGQVIDLASEGKEIDYTTLKTIDGLKTGALIQVSAQLGCIAAGAEQELIDRATTYAANVGLAFQIVDDILDITADQTALGKPTGSDAENQKTTYATLFGIDRSKEMVKDLVLQADLAIKGTRLDHSFLYELADMLADRQY